MLCVAAALLQKRRRCLLCVEAALVTIMNVQIKARPTNLLAARSMRRSRMPPPKQDSVPLSSLPDRTQMTLLPVALNPVVSNPRLETVVTQSDHAEMSGVSLVLSPLSPPYFSLGTLYKLDPVPTKGISPLSEAGLGSLKEQLVPTKQVIPNPHRKRLTIKASQLASVNLWSFIFIPVNNNKWEQHEFMRLHKFIFMVFHGFLKDLQHSAKECSLNTLI